MFSHGRQFSILLITLLLAAALIGATLWLRSGRDKRDRGAVAERGAPVRRVSLLAVHDRGLSPYSDAFVLMRPLDIARLGTASRFDSPLGSEHGAMAYNAQPFGENDHLGDDLNGIGGWDSDLGDPVFAAGDGRVVFAGRPSEGWGNLMMVAHRLRDGRVLRTVYAHLDTMKAAVDDRVARGDVIGTVGKGGLEQYLAHLHFEVREARSLSPGSGYEAGRLDRLDPERFLRDYRGAPDAFLGAAPRFGKAPGEAEGEGAAGLEVRVEGAESSAARGAGEEETARELRQ